MKTTVIIPNYNGMKYIENCIKSLCKQSNKDFSIIIVDNNSEDGSREWIRRNHPEIKLIMLSENYGFSKAVNEGIRNSETPYIILLNNDTEVHSDFVKSLVEAMDQSKGTFSVSSKMISFHNRRLIDNVGDYYTVMGWAYSRGNMEPVKRYCIRDEIFSACAGAAIYKREIFDEIGLFDEMHFAYLEDVDIGYRARIAGYKNIYEPKAMVYHLGSATSGSKHNKFKIHLAARNSVYLIYKNMPIVQIVINAIPLFLGYLIKAIYFAKKGYGCLYIKSVMQGIKTVGKCNKVPFKLSNLKNYCKIEYELLRNTLYLIKLK